MQNDFANAENPFLAYCLHSILPILYRAQHLSLKPFHNSYEFAHIIYRPTLINYSHIFFQGTNKAIRNQEFLVKISGDSNISFRINLYHMAYYLS